MQKKLFIIGITTFFVTFGVTVTFKTFFHAPYLRAELLTQEEEDDEDEDSIDIDTNAEAQQKIKQANRAILKYQRAGATSADIRELKKILSNMHDALAEEGSDELFWDFWSEFQAKENDMDELNGDTPAEVDEDTEMPEVQIPKYIEKPVKKIPPAVKPVKKILQPVKTSTKASGKISAPAPNPYKPGTKVSAPVPNPFAPTPEPYKMSEKYTAPGQPKSSKTNSTKKPTQQKSSKGGAPGAGTKK